MAKQANELRQFFELESQLNKIQDLDILLERILLEARRMVKADAGTIYVRKGDVLAFAYTQNDTMQRALPPGRKLTFSTFTVKIDEKTISGYCAATGRLVNITNAYRLSKKAPYSFNSAYDKQTGYRTRSILALPLKTNTGEILGVLQVINAMADTSFTKQDELVVTHFASTATVALQRAQMTRAILLRMIRMAEMRDPKETGAHVNRVAGYAVEIYDRWAFNQGLPERQIERIRDILRMAAMLHDVGKVGISDIILKKAGRLNADEYEIMKDHTLIGARLFADKQSEFDEMASIVALSHHECWDGSGYPSKSLRGHEIPLFGRIVAIADVYDALSCHRVYKEAWKEEDVLAEMRRLAGTKFDPELIDTFFEILPDIKTLAGKYPDAK